MLHIFAREMQAAFAFLDELAPAQRTPVRMEGSNKMRIANAGTVLNALGWIGAGMNPADAPEQRRHLRHRPRLGDRHFAGGPPDRSRHVR